MLEKNSVPFAREDGVGAGYCTLVFQRKVGARVKLVEEKKLGVLRDAKRKPA